MRAGRLVSATLGGAWALGCAAPLPLGAELRRVESFAAERHGAKERACAPEELALADAHLRFARVELARGNTARAREHLALAELNARAARVLTREACTPDGAEPMAQVGAGLLGSRPDAAHHGASSHASLPVVTTLGRLRERVALDAHATRAASSAAAPLSVPHLSVPPRPGA